ncbi:MAG: hypothetical protein ACKVQT_19980 [Burkholderiales bacterium]
MIRSLATVFSLAFLVAGTIAVDDASAGGGRGSGARSGGGHAHHGHHGHRGGVGHVLGHPRVHFHGVRPWVGGVAIGALVAAPLVYHGYSAYYGPGPYYYPPAYVEQGTVPIDQAPASWWYYCQESNTYYPYVRECSGAWQRVAPTPPR